MQTYSDYKDSGVEWLGEIPAGWEVKRLKYLLRINNGVDYKSVISESGFPVYGSGGKFAYAMDYLFDGEAILLGRKGTIDKPLIVNGRFWTVDTMFYAVLKTSASIKFIYYSTTLIPFDFYSTSTALPSMTQSDLNNHEIFLPSLQEQTAIAHFLDNKVSKIERLLAIKQQQIELLKERKQILIQNAVTQGLNPNAPKKASGVDWIGDIPVHWEVRRSKYIFSQRKELAYKDDEQLSATQAYGVILQKEYEKKVARRVVKIQFNLKKRKHVEIDDFVISMRSFQGGLERAWAKGCIRSSYVILKPTSCVNSSYFGFLLKESRYIEALQSTASFIRDGQDLNFGNFSKVDLMIPPFAEQKEISLFVSNQSKKIDTAIHIKQQQIEKLTEYKTTLINSVVTGKIKVTPD